MRYSSASFCTDIRLQRETADRLGELEYDVGGVHPRRRTIARDAREAVRAFLAARRSTAAVTPRR